MVTGVAKAAARVNACPVERCDNEPIRTVFDSPTSQAVGQAVCQALIKAIVKADSLTI